MKREYYARKVPARKCGEPVRDHLCQGPLYRVTHNGEKRYLCLGAIKGFIKRGHDVDVGRNVPRKFEYEGSDVHIMDPPWKRKEIFKDKKR